MPTELGSGEAKARVQLWETLPIKMHLGVRTVGLLGLPAMEAERPQIKGSTSLVSFQAAPPSSQMGCLFSHSSVSTMCVLVCCKNSSHVVLGITRWHHFMSATSVKHWSFLWRGGWNYNFGKMVPPLMATLTTTILWPCYAMTRMVTWQCLF